VIVSSRSVVVLGGDPAAATVAARLARDGYEVVLWEAPAAREPGIGPCERPRLRLSGAGGEAVVTLAATTSDPFAALAASDVLLTCGLSRAPAFTDLVLPLLEPRHTLVLLSDSLGSLACAKWLRDRGRGELPTLVESDTVPFVGHRLAPDHLFVSAAVTSPSFGVFPARRTEAVQTLLTDLFAGARVQAHVLAVALAALEPFLRVPALLMSAGAAEHPRPGCSLFEDGFSPAVARVAEALDGERLALAAALGLDLPTAAEALHAWGIAPHGDLWAAVNGSFTLTHAAAGAAEPADSLAGDAAFVLRPWTELGDHLGVPVPICRSLLTLIDAANGADQGQPGRSLDDLGIAGLDAAALDRFLVTGIGEPT
jgi:opine dehydrogenase